MKIDWGWLKWEHRIEHHYDGEETHHGRFGISKNVLLGVVSFIVVVAVFGFLSLFGIW